MRTAELLSRLVIAQEISPRDLRDEYFNSFDDEWDFLKTYHQQNGQYPNRETFVEQFPGFDFSDTGVTAHWLRDEVEQDLIEAKIALHLETIKAQCETNPREAILSLSDATRDMLAYMGGAISSSGDLRDAQPIIDEIERRRKASGITGVTLGFHLLDDVCKGTQPGEIEVYFARPGIGKSFVLLWGALAASRAGVKVAFISPEMDRFEVGTRYASYVTHVSSMELFSGDMDSEEIAAFRERALKHASEGEPILFYEPSTIGRQFTTADVMQIIRHEQPGVVCIDGLMLIEPVRQDKDIRKRIINVMAELKDISVETGIPIRLAHQANRSSEQTRRRDPVVVEDIIPSLHHMAESGSVEQYANRAIGLARVGGQLLMGVRKNRNGPSGRFISVRHDIDHGRFEEDVPINGDQEVDQVVQAALYQVQEQLIERDPSSVF